MFNRAKYIEQDISLLPVDQQFTREMFGYDAGIQGRYDRLPQEGRNVLGVSNFGSNQAYVAHRNDPRIPYDMSSTSGKNAAQMDRIFDQIIRERTFETQQVGIVYRSWTCGVENVSDICNKSLGRYTSTSVRKEYSDTWGTEPTPGCTKPNDKGFFATIIIPANTRSVIPLLLFDELRAKTAQYEVLLHPDGRFIDTGYSDSTGFRIIVYIGPENAGLFSAPLSEILNLSDPNSNIKGLIESGAISPPGNEAHFGGKRRKTRRYKRSKRTKKY